MERGSEVEKRQPPKLNQCMHGGSASRHKSSGNQSIRLVPLLTELLLHHPEIHQKHLLEAFSASGARISVNQRLHRQLTNHLPPNVKVSQLLCFYSHIKRIILILELTEQAMSLPKFILPTVTSKRVRLISIKILTSNLKPKKPWNWVKWKIKITSAS